MVNKLLDKYYWFNYARAKHAYNNAVPFRNFLPEEFFDSIVSKYKNIPFGPAQDYSINGMEMQANSRINDLHKKLTRRPESVLEIGPGAGYVLKGFKDQGVKRVVAVDVVDMLYDDVKNTGVEFIKTDAENMHQVEDKSIDLVISWSAFEHIANPERVYAECLRILKPGGYFLLQFGPLYFSPWGYHHYSVLKYPYLHILFPENVIHQYARNVRGENYGGYLPWTNGKELDAYQFLKKQLPFDFLLESYQSGFDYYSTRILLKFPEIFKSKGVSFESFFVDNIRVGIYRKG